mmetsp:Transcript_6616/g.16914  ORF Transcript_6616/g.16914 Transcript_6616/m.16914 type:complete len:207 (-) Transcript_6616:2611-3231(-)
MARSHTASCASAPDRNSTASPGTTVAPVLSDTVRVEASSQKQDAPFPSLATVTVANSRQQLDAEWEVLQSAAPGSCVRLRPPPWSEGLENPRERKAAVSPKVAVVSTGGGGTYASVTPLPLLPPVSAMACPATRTEMVCAHPSPLGTVQVTTLCGTTTTTFVQTFPPTVTSITAASNPKFDPVTLMRMPPWDGLENGLTEATLGSS